MKIFETHPIITNLKKIKKNKNYLIFSGIGNPDSFRKLLKKNNLKISKSISYPDHYEYSKSDIYFIKNQAKTLKSKILTTEKDYLRIKKEYRSGINFIKIKLDIDKKKDL